MRSNYEQAYFWNEKYLLQTIWFWKSLENNQKVIEINNKNFHAYNNIGVILKKNGNLAEAIEYFKKSHNIILNFLHQSIIWQ